MATLYELTNEYLQLLDMVSDENVDEEVLKDTMEAIDGEIEIKCDNYGFIIKELQAKADAVDAEIKRLEERKKMWSSNADRIKGNLAAEMKKMNKDKVKTSLFTFFFKKNPKSVVLNEGIDWNDVPMEFLKPQEPKIDKMAIKKALESGKEFNFAHLEQGESFQMK